MKKKALQDKLLDALQQEMPVHFDVDASGATKKKRPKRKVGMT